VLPRVPQIWAAQQRRPATKEFIAAPGNWSGFLAFEFLNAVCFASLRMAMRDPGLQTEELSSLDKSPE
jgi:hypothetical protein